MKRIFVGQETRTYEYVKDCDQICTDPLLSIRSESVAVC